MNQQVATATTYNIAEAAFAEGASVGGCEHGVGRRKGTQDLLGRVEHRLGEGEVYPEALFVVGGLNQPGDALYLEHLLRNSGGDVHGVTPSICIYRTVFQHAHAA